MLSGIQAPSGDGLVLEVHLDLEKLTPIFGVWLSTIGFEDDPFEVFVPEWCRHHRTGRMRVPKEELHAAVLRVNQLTEQVLARARADGIGLYLEVELVREVWRSAGPDDQTWEGGVLDGYRFLPTGISGGAKADVHVEFTAGRVPPAVRQYLAERCFYWVATPVTQHFPAEEIATLQPTSYSAAREVYHCLVERPLRQCTAIHLEQKLTMVGSEPHLVMPEAVQVTKVS